MDRPSVVDRERSAAAYDGPLDARAVGALECDGKTPYQRSAGIYDDGLAQVQENAEAALDNYMRESGLSFLCPATATPSSVRQTVGVALLRRERPDESRAVRCQQHSRLERRPGLGPPRVGAVRSIGVPPGRGRRPRTSACGRTVRPARAHYRIRSFQGAEHCSWTDITFLLVGPEQKADWYVRDTNGEFSELLRTTFASNATLPQGATDTGLRRDGRQLWIGPDEEAAYLVSIDDPEDVARWPAAKQPIGCA